MILAGAEAEALFLGARPVKKNQRWRTLPLRSVAQALLERFRSRLLLQSQRRERDFCRSDPAPGDEDLIDLRFANLLPSGLPRELSFRDQQLQPSHPITHLRAAAGKPGLPGVMIGSPALHFGVRHKFVL